MTIALLFPGQGSQFVGMGKDFYDKYDQAKNVYNQLDVVLNRPLTDLIFNGTDEEIALTTNSQPAIMATSIAILRCLQHEELINLPSVSYTAGHSLGEYSALMFAESITFEDAIGMTHLRGKLMQHSEEGKMMAILGLDSKTIDEACSQINESHKSAYVASANYNSVKQTVIAGNIEGIEIARDFLPEIGAKRCMELNVSIASHTWLMTDAANEFNESLQKINFSAPRYPIIQNYTGEIETDISTIKQNLFNQLTKPVLWTKTKDKKKKTFSSPILK